MQPKPSALCCRRPSPSRRPAANRLSIVIMMALVIIVMLATIIQQADTCKGGGGKKGGYGGKMKGGCKMKGEKFFKKKKMAKSVRGPPTYDPYEYEPRVRAARYPRYDEYDYDEPIIRRSGPPPRRQPRPQQVIVRHDYPSHYNVDDEYEVRRPSRQFYTAPPGRPRSYHEEPTSIRRVIKDALVKKLAQEVEGLRL